VHEFHSGAALFAMRTQAHLIPAGIFGSFKPFSKVKLVVGKALDLSEYHKKRTDATDIEKVNVILFQRIRELADAARTMA
jgi:1-acyl-sn-glycerol-3-phosphate acyltransferase